MSQLSPDLAKRERRAQFMWTSFILMFFAIQAVIWTVAISITANDRSHAVVAGYDEKALNWDREKAILTNSEKLGWQSSVMIADPEPGQANIGFRKISVQIKQADSTPVSGASVRLNAFHCGLASETQQIALNESDDIPGSYEGEILVHQVGLWQIDGQVQRETDVYIIDHRTKIGPGL